MPKDAAHCVLLVPEQHGAGGAVLADPVERAVEGVRREPLTVPVGQEIAHDRLEFAQNLRGYVGGYVRGGGLGVRRVLEVLGAFVFVDALAREVDDLCVT